jgi:NTP pyrophosphatase (non-canonical NTP hydrolase)
MLSEELIRKLIDFRKKRDWEKYHKPKDLAVSLVIEASELLEIFQWKSDQEIKKLLNGDMREKISEEMADIAIYLTYLCNDLNIDLNDIVSKKIDTNRKKYPSKKVKGSAKKYSEY